MGGGGSDFTSSITNIIPGSSQLSQWGEQLFGSPIKLSDKPGKGAPPPRPRQKEAVTRKRRRTESSDFTQLGTILTGPQGALLGIPMEGADGLLVDDTTGKKNLLG